MTLASSQENNNSYVAGRFVAANYGRWSFLPTNVQRFFTGTTTFTVLNPLVRLPDLREFLPFSTNAPIMFGTEVFIPSVVSYNADNTVCTLTVDFTQEHNPNEQVSSATLGLQEALNDAAAFGGCVTVDGQWSELGGTTLMITDATVPSGTGIEDVRTGPAGGGGGGNLSGTLTTGFIPIATGTNTLADSTLDYGVSVDNGLTVTNTGSGGLSITDQSAAGIVIEEFSGTGALAITNTGSGGTEITDSGGGGITITNSVGTGISVQDSAGGVIIQATGTSGGIDINNSGSGGTAITDSGGNGVVVTNLNAASSVALESNGAILINNTGATGTQITDSGGSGIAITNSSTGGVNVSATDEISLNAPFTIFNILGQITQYSVGGTPLPVAPPTGVLAVVLDATLPTYRATYTGGGSEVCLVIFDGANWLTI